jgi:3-oxoacyl-[acyl-carrier protein] reductase
MPAVEPLHDQVALVTGSSRGLGAVIAQRLAAEGATVAINYRVNEERALEVAARITAAGGRASVFGADTTDEAAVEKLVSDIHADLGPIRILVNNSGTVNDSPIETMPVDVWDDMMASHLRSTFLVTRACLARGMARQAPIPGRRVAGKIVNISSGIVAAAGRAGVGKVHYLTAKAGVAAFSRALAAEVAPTVTVNSVSPGIHFTDMMAHADDALKEELASIFLLGLPRDEDVAAAVAFFAGPDSDHLTAESLMPNGGAA